jgi:solute carrier family 25 carnitine/acylcarnitine transporter 20/29
MTVVGESNLSEYKKGAIIGISQTILGHPLDTLKTWRQNGNNTKLILDSQLKINIRNLYRGVSYPLILSIGYNSFLFGCYGKLRNEKYSSIEAGVASGAILGILSNPFEYYKIQSQTNRSNISLFPFRGLHYTLWRESISCGLYFTSYEYFTQNLGLSSFIAGGISGCSSWAVTYPIDTVKTRFQANPSFKGKYYIQQGNLWQGIGFCLVRAFLVNGVSFTLYEMM